MNEDNKENKLTEEDKNDKNERQYVSFSETDENGKINEVYGYFEKQNGGTFEQRVQFLRDNVNLPKRK